MEDVVGARFVQLVDLLALARRGEDVAAVVFGEQGRPQAHTAGSAMHQDGGVGCDLCGKEE